jgi:hypothetical protein
MYLSIQNIVMVLREITVKRRSTRWLLVLLILPVDGSAMKSLGRLLSSFS